MMGDSSDILNGRTLDELLHDVPSLEFVVDCEDLVTSFLSGEFAAVLSNTEAQILFATFIQRLSGSKEVKAKHSWHDGAVTSTEACKIFIIGLAAFDAFLQANVTGPPLSVSSLLFSKDLDAPAINNLRQECFLSLSKDGLSVYQHIPHVELYAFARAIFLEYFPAIVGSKILESRWMRVRINTYHQRLLSSGASNARLSDSAEELQIEIEKDLEVLEAEILGEHSQYSTEAKVMFVLEKAQIYIMQGLDLKARQSVNKAAAENGFVFQLSGALGKRTRFQQTDISQLVVLARSVDSADKDETEDQGEVLQPSLEDLGLADDENTAPTALELNDDTLLESIKFKQGASDAVDQSKLPTKLRGLRPDEQPQLKPLDHITLLTEATLKDSLSPMDKLNSEEILPYAVRVLSDKPTNWQIYTQALLVRSRIEAHRSRTQERSVLQLQAIVDQIVADTEQEKAMGGGDGLPQIQVTQFFPRAKASESAPVQERLKYINQLNSPTRWEIETELAYAWSKAGSFLSALEIFKRLKLWPEVALCYHSVEQMEKARQIIRRQLYHSTKGPLMDQYEVDDDEIASETWEGEIRSPPPPHAPRLWCILGDLEQQPECWELAWEISNHRYARAQRTLGEFYSRAGEFVKAREAYLKATVVNRQNNDTWSRLGDIDLRLGNWDGAVIAFQQSIMLEDTDAKTYSNLGSALLSKYSEMMELQKLQGAPPKKMDADDEDYQHGPIDMTPKDILRQALIAYKKGASIAHDNWKIWDNVITIAGRMSPPSYPEILMAMKAVIRIRGPQVGEEAVDIDILRALVGEVTSMERPAGTGVLELQRGSLARAVVEMVEKDIVPLITARAGLWFLVEKLALYRRDYATALSSAEKAWRIATSGEEWLEDGEKWKVAADATDGLVSAYENYGPMEVDGVEVEKGWKIKARSAVRSIMGKARNSWEGTKEWEVMQERLDDLKRS